MEGGVLFDGWCGEPIAWARVGDPIIGHEWTENGSLAVTERLSPTEAVRKYGPITELRVGPNRGFKSVTYGTTKFVSRFVDPRATKLYDETVVVVDDPVVDNYECPGCNVPPGAQCVDKDGRPRGKHLKRSQGRSRWDIEREQEAARIAREEAESAERFKRELATPPAISTDIEIKRWKLLGAPTWELIPDTPDCVTVERTYANRTVEGATESGTRMFLARSEITGDWHAICGHPTSARLPCRNGGDGLPCRARHKTGLQLRYDAPWN
jgi:hypothetical protein